MKFLIVSALILSSFMETRAGSEDFCTVLQPQDRSDRWGKGDSTLEISALSRPLHLGMLYNARKDQLIPDACDVTLDINTAFVGVSLSEGNRKVQRVEENQSYPDRPERFDCFGQVLSVESWTGRCYWEVECSGSVEISVSYGRIQRKGCRDECRFGRNKNSWSLYCSGNSFTLYHNKQETKIPAPPSPSKRVGVYLDWEGGTLSFYTIPSNTHTLTHLHTLTATFTEPLYAGFTLFEQSSASVCVLE